MMDERLGNALATLADKLGVSVEQVWGILLAQAKLSACTDISIICALAIVSYFWTALVLRKTRRDAGATMYTSPVWCGEAAFFSWVSMFICWSATALALVVSLHGIINAFLSPEYWALRKLFYLLKSVS